MGRVCESLPLRPSPGKKELVDIVGADIGHYEAPNYERITPVLVERNRRAAQVACEPQTACEPRMDNMAQDVNALPPCDQRYVITDPLLQRTCPGTARPRDCPAEQKPVADACDHIGQRTLADFYCTEHNLYDAAARNYFKYGETQVHKTKCQYPFPCKAHCFEHPPVRDPLADSPVHQPFQVDSPRHYQYSTETEACGSGKRNGL